MDNLVSVIIPVYKVEDFLPRCIESVLQQTYKKLEIILVNDGSPDRSGKICDEYAKIDSRITVKHKENGGLSSARNAGIDIAKGDYLVFIDSDDWVHESYVEKLLGQLEGTGSDIAACNFQKIADETKIEKDLHFEIYELTKLEALERLTTDLYVQLVIACGKIYRSELFDDIRYPLGKFHEDEYVAHYLLHAADKIVYSTERLYFYWQRLDSITNQGFDIRKRLDAIEALKERSEFFERLSLIRQRDNTNKMLFYVYARALSVCKECQSKPDFIKGFKGLKFNLREGKFRFKFKLLYELFYLLPLLMKNVIRIFEKQNAMQ